MRILHGLALLPALHALACGRPSHAAEEAAPTPARSFETHARSIEGAAAPAMARWTTAYRAGGVDASGHPMGGTELRFLVPFEGKLYAGIGYWEDSAATDPKTPGGQVLVKDSAGAPWRVDLELDDRVRGGAREGQRRDFAIGGLGAVTLTTDARGVKLATPARLLVASPWSRGPGLDVLVGGADGAWQRTELSRGKGSARSFGEHVDRATGVSRIFAGSDLGIYGGAYDARTRSVVWDGAPEPWSPGEAPSGDWRVMAFAECDGELYATAGTSLYERQDGAVSRWKRVYTANLPGATKGSGGLRGLTAIENPKGPGHVLLVAAEGDAARMVRVDPHDGFAETAEEDVVALLSRVWHAPVTRVLLAYNDMTKVNDPRTGEPLLLVGLQARIDPRATAPFPTWEHHRSGAAYLVRRPTGTYEVHAMEEPAPAASRPVDRVAVRTMALSPFAPDTLYAGGFDANRHAAHDTAWALQGGVATAIAP